MMTFSPSTYPSSRNPPRKAATQGLYCSSSPEPSDRKPIRQILPVGCASAVSGATRLETRIAMRPSVLSLMAGYAASAAKTIRRVSDGAGGGDEVGELHALVRRRPLLVGADVAG